MCVISTNESCEIWRKTSCVARRIIVAFILGGKLASQESSTYMLVIHEVNSSQTFVEHREKYFYDDTAIDKMVRSENRVVQSDKMVVRRETRDKLVDLQMWHARRPAQRLCYILRGWLLIF